MRISVVTPSLNQARFLEACLRSVSAQSGGDFEHLVFDGGSTDVSVDILRRWGTTVRWVSRRDGGQSDALNQGFRASDGHIVGWLNSDDFYYPGAFDAVRAAFAADSTLDAVYGQADHVDIDGVAYERFPSEAWNPARLVATCYICQPALFLRRRAIERVGLLNADLNFCMDYEYWLRMARAGLVAREIPAKLAASRMYPANKTMRSRVRMHAEINTMLRNQLGVTPDCWLFNYGHAVAGGVTSRDRLRRTYGALMVLGALFAAVRWNGKVSRSMVHDIAALIRKSLGRAR
ncbi:MAG: glycosyltransferase family 2 protein [Burkholderiales bacterium]|jgi:glycosyltransferase involved in cell wall biosynthesis